MYFESREDDVRIPGWSKDGKNANPQVVLGLLVGSGGNPIGYEIHPGNTYEGHTMLPIIKKLQERFNFPKPIVVADAGLLSNENIRDLEEGKHSRKYVRRYSLTATCISVMPVAVFLWGCDIDLSYFADNALQFPGRRSA